MVLPLPSLFSPLPPKHHTLILHPFQQVQGLVIGVMYEKALGPQSKWGPYLSFLPTDLSHMIIYWTVGGRK